ncbi:MAG: hypothetical protein F4Y84_20060 [Caldilineaceae bacterium SB0665_bin_25]|nr:hypothetical protein [Caldilineaceae bacterium SB0665_bin_25]
MNTESDRHRPSGPAANRKRAALKAICQQHGVVILYSFGSRARETLAWLDDPKAVLTPDPSDVDLGVKPLPATDFNRKTEVVLELALEGLLGVESVVLVNLQCADPFFAFEVIKGERLYAESEYSADNYDLYIMAQVGDLTYLKEVTEPLLFGVPK